MREAVLARGQPVSFGDLHFTKKGDARDFLKAMLHRYRPGDRVNDADAAVLLEVLKRHPENSEKLGSGFQQFEVHRATEFGTKCFWIKRTDGSLEDFSYFSCI